MEQTTKSITSETEFRRFAVSAKQADRDYKVLGKTLTYSKNMLKSWMISNDVKQYVVDGVTWCALTDVVSTKVDWKAFETDEPEAYKNVKFFVDKYTRNVYSQRFEFKEFKWEDYNYGDEAQCA